MMRKMVHNVLGTEYEVLFGDRKDIDMSIENMGECRVYTKKILICTERGCCTEEELRVRVQEVVAHEVLHAYLNEAGVDLDTGRDIEEKMCDFYMKNWRKINNSILEILDENDFFDN